MTYRVVEDLQIRPLSIKGRFFAFTVTPPTVLQIDSLSLMLLKLCEKNATQEELVAKFSDLLNTEPEAARREVTDRADALAASGLLKRLPG